MERKPFKYQISGEATIELPATVGEAADIKEKFLHTIITKTYDEAINILYNELYEKYSRVYTSMKSLKLEVLNYDILRGQE